jgi:hypothetical protein
MRSAFLTAALMLLGAFAFAQQTQFPTDPKTGRAIGAKEMTPEQLPTGQPTEPARTK